MTRTEARTLYRQALSRPRHDMVDWLLLAVWLGLLAFCVAVSLGALYGLDLAVRWVVGAR